MDKNVYIYQLECLEILQYKFIKQVLGLNKRSLASYLLYALGVDSIQKCVKKAMWLSR